MSDNEKKARELLAAEYERSGLYQSAADLRSGRFNFELGWAREAEMAIRAIIAALKPREGYVPEHAMMRVATGLREKASRSARPLERKTLIASAEAVEKTVSAARPEVSP